MKSESREITKDLIAQHGLTEEEYKRIVEEIEHEDKR